MFSDNTSEGDKQRGRQILQIHKETMNERYLRLPVFVGRARSPVFAYLKDPVWKRIQGSKEKLLSKAGKEVLVKAVAQAIPTFFQWDALILQKKYVKQDALVELGEADTTLSIWPC